MYYFAMYYFKNKILKIVHIEYVLKFYFSTYAQY